MPNRAVDVNSWARSACYPRSTFYPLSDGPSIQNHRITKTYFRTCSTCRLAVKLPYAFTLFARFPTSAEPTFVRLRYSLGGDRPSQTTHHTLSPVPDNGTWVRTSTIARVVFQGWLHRRLASTLQSLPPILHKQHQDPMSSCSKGSRGLSVLPRVHGIFTATSISLSLGLRQCGHRYAIRAGRNLPDKEFRYLRTVIVTAAVYRGFDQELRPPYIALVPALNVFARSVIYFYVNSFTRSAGLQEQSRGGITPSINLRHRAGVTPYTSTYVHSTVLCF